jgi:hypothetical protein
MKNLKYYSLFTFLGIFTSLLIVSCSKEEEDKKINSTPTNNNQNPITICDLVGQLNVGSGNYNYTYTNNSGHTNINWTVTPSSAGNIINGQGTSTITINFNASCRLSAYGTGGTGGICEDIKPITKTN